MVSITTFFVGFIFLGGSLLGAASGDCGDPPVPAHGSIATSPTTKTAGSEATVACNSGYTMVGTTIISCQNDDSWSSPGTCTVSGVCGDPAVPAHGSMLTPPTALTEGSVATVACDSGYTMVGTVTISCQNDGSWSTPGTCTDITQVLGIGVNGTQFTGDDVKDKTTNLTLAESFVENATITTLTIVDFVPALWTIDTEHDLLAVDAGVVSLATGKSFDYETSPVVKSVVTATDSSDPVVTATVTLILVLTNVNDNAPVFDPATYPVGIAKGSEEGTKLVTVYATDADGDSITYTLTSGDYFSINGTTGTISVAVNRTIEAAYTFVVMATDSGIPPMNATATVSVTLNSGYVVGVSIIALFGLLLCQLL